MAKWRQHLRGESNHQQQQQQQPGQDDDDKKTKSASSDCYDLPCGMSFIRRWTLFKFVPFCPTFLVDAKESEAVTDQDVDMEGAAVTRRAKKALE